MRIAWIGGPTRSSAALAREARRFGHWLEAHDGVVGGRGSDSLRAMIARSDIVVALTDVNSHGAIGLARRTATEQRRPILLLRRCGAARLRELLSSLGVAGGVHARCC